METSDTFVERRQHQRFACKNCAVTVNFKACPIVNISMGGFAFRYTNSVDWQQDKIEGAILFGDNIYLEDIPFYAVSDIIAPDTIPELIENRERGVRFGKLNPDQLAGLEEYISHLAATTIMAE
jgi:hypothetical protein